MTVLHRLFTPSRERQPYIANMSNDQRLMDFEEFRESEPMGEVVRQQREHFRNFGAVEALLQPGALSVRGWIEWPDGSPTKVRA